LKELIIKKTKKESEKKLMKEVREGFKENIVLKTIKTDARINL
jgi:hypothetical protein